MDKVLSYTKNRASDRTYDVRKGTSSFVVGVLSLSSAAALGQAVVILSAPITSRLFAPEVFGIAAVFASFVAIFTVISCLGYELAVMLPRRDSEAASLFGLCCILAIATSLILVVVVAFWGRQILAVLGASEIIPYIWLLPLGIFLFGIALPLRYWASRHRRFIQLSATNVAASVSAVVATISLGAAGCTSEGHLIIARLLTPLCTFVMLTWFVLRYDLLFILRESRIGTMWRMSKRYFKFPLFNTWASLLNAAFYQTPVIVLTFFFGASVAGFFWRATSLFAIPGLLITQAISQVFFQKAAEKRARGESLSGLVEELCQRLSSFIIFPLLVTVLIGKDVFVVVLGPRWAEAGVYAAILVPWQFFTFTTGSLMNLFDVLERQGTNLLFNLLFLVTRSGALILGGLVLKDVRYTILLFSVISAAGYALRAQYVFSISGASLRRIILLLKDYFVFATPFLVIIAISKWWIQMSSTWLLFTGMLGFFPYYIYVLRRDMYLRQAFSQITRTVVPRGWFSKLR